MPDWRIFTAVIEASPRPDNDIGLPAEGRFGERTVILSCTGYGIDGLTLDLVLRSGDTDQTLITGITERDAIAEARKLAGLYAARLAMLSTSGHLVQLEPAPMPGPRRLGSPLSGRRPRFLAMRKPGVTAKQSRDARRLVNAEG